MLKLKWAALKCVSATSLFSGCSANLSYSMPFCLLFTQPWKWLFFLFLILNKHMSSSHRTESYSNLTWPIYIALNIGLELTSSVKNEEVYSHSICVHCCCLLTCELLRLSCHVAVPTMVPGHLTSCWEQILFVTPNLSEMKPREMLRNWLFNPQKLCLFDVNGLKRF